MTYAYEVATEDDGTVVLITLGTGIGTALFVDGRLVPNMELGHIEIRGREAEARASAVSRERRKLSWAAYAKLLDESAESLDRYFLPFAIAARLEYEARLPERSVAPEA